MRLAEKLARDVYTTLGEVEDSYPAFLNIASSEQKHMDQILKLLVKYEIDDPILTFGEGEFPDFATKEYPYSDYPNFPDFQALYDDYIELEDGSYEDPLDVGIAIETLIIAYLEVQLANEDVIKTDIIKVYTCLLAASEKHLVAFTK
ncbi:MAG: DUF2202 domain-containing protein [Ignavibacteriaceae bacterium]|nr:DUF2202 domain-containing protein [Ignavibacteriaceae bacterium]